MITGVCLVNTVHILPRLASPARCRETDDGCSDPGRWRGQSSLRSEEVAAISSLRSRSSLCRARLVAHLGKLCSSGFTRHALIQKFRSQHITGTNNRHPVRQRNRCRLSLSSQLILFSGCERLEGVLHTDPGIFHFFVSDFASSVALITFSKVLPHPDSTTAT